MTIERKLLLPLAMLGIGATLGGCKDQGVTAVAIKDATIPSKSAGVVQDIYNKSPWQDFAGIAECDIDGQKIFTSQPMGAYDGGKQVFDANGNRIGDCNYSTGNVSPICSSLIPQKCKFVYIPKDGMAAIVAQPTNKYNIKTK